MREPDSTLDGHRCRTEDTVVKRIQHVSIFVALVASLHAEPQPPMGPFTIPVVDLDQVDQHHVVVDREKGQYLGHPSSVVMGDGATMWIVYPRGHGRGPIVLKKSEDGGLTWGERLETPRNWVTSQETPTLYQVRDVVPEDKSQI